MLSIALYPSSKPGPPASRGVECSGGVDASTFVKLRG